MMIRRRRGGRRWRGRRGGQNKGRPRLSRDPAWRSLSPMYMLMSSGPFTLRKFTAHSFATALACHQKPRSRSGRAKHSQ